MVSVNAAGSGTQRRIALIKPRFASDEQAGHAVQLFDSVLWVFKGSTRSSWQLAADDDAAQVVVVHHSEPVAQVERWSRAGKIVITLSTDKTKHPAGPHTLLYPFPAVQVLSLLERVEAELDGWIDAPAPSSTSTPTRRGADPWAFVESLRTLRSVSNPALWLECKGERGVSLWIRGDGSRYFCDDDTAAAIRAGTIDLGALTPNKSSRPADDLPMRPGLELYWFATYHASSALASWLQPTTEYRLLRWPDFGVVRASDETARTAQIRIVAALADTPASVTALVTRTQTPGDLATRTINALSSCALIEPATSITAPTRGPSHTPVPQGGLKLLLSNLRKHLRLGAR